MKTPKQDSKSSQTVTTEMSENHSDWQDPDDAYRNGWGKIIENAERHDVAHVPVWTPMPVKLEPDSFLDRVTEWIGIALLIAFFAVPLVLLIAFLLLLSS